MHCFRENLGILMALCTVYLLAGSQGTPIHDIVLVGNRTGLVWLKHSGNLLPIMIRIKAPLFQWWPHCAHQFKGKRLPECQTLNRVYNFEERFLRVEKVSAETL